jgi:hypothetical protein
MKAKASDSYTASLLWVLSIFDYAIEMDELIEAYKVFA